MAGQNKVLFVEQIQDMPQTILNMAQAGDVVVTMGAGSIGGVANMLKNIATSIGVSSK